MSPNLCRFILAPHFSFVYISDNNNWIGFRTICPDALNLPKKNQHVDVWYWAKPSIYFHSYRRKNNVLLAFFPRMKAKNIQSNNVFFQLNLFVVRISIEWILQWKSRPLAQATTHKKNDEIALNSTMLLIKVLRTEVLLTQ